MTRESVKCFVSDLHLYPNKVEALIKDSVLLISWVAGIMVPYLSDSQEALAGSAFVLALSLFMELVTKIDDRETLHGRVWHMVLLLMIIVTGFVSVYMLFSANYRYNSVVFSSSLVIALELLFDFILACLWPTRNLHRKVEKNQNREEENKNEVAIQTYLKNLHTGNLGNVEGDEEK